MSERAHMLEAPLRELKFGHSMDNWTRQSMDRSVLEQIHVGDGAPELVGRVRYDRNAQSLIDLIVAGSQGKTLTYIPDLDDPDVSFACDLVAPLTPTALQLDAQRGVLGDQSVELILRETTQGAFDPLIKGTAVLFAYSAGGSLREATFTRSSSAVRTDKGYGTLVASSSNEARLDWISTAGSSEFRNTPSLLLEETRTNYVEDSEDFSQWTAINAPALTSGQSDPYGGTNAFKIEDDSTSLIERISEIVSLDSSGPFGCSLFVKESTAPSTDGTIMWLRDLDSTENRMETYVLFSSGIPTQTIVTGSSFGEPERVRDNWWRITVLSDTNISTASTNALQVFPARFDTIGDALIFGAQVE
jgi:hypothetical protein